MAITIDDILGKNTREAENMQREPRFYGGPEIHDDYIPTVEEVRAREASRTYSAPSQNEFRSEAFESPIFDNAATYQRQQQTFRQSADNGGFSQNRTAPDFTGDNFSQNRYSNRMDNPSMPQNTVGYNDAAQSKTFYDFNADENAENAQYYLDKLSNGNQYDPNSDFYSSRDDLGRANSVQPRNSSAKRKLNVKGKIIIGLYAALAVVVITLIAVNASRINKGTALAPTSAIAETSISTIK